MSGQPERIADPWRGLPDFIEQARALRRTDGDPQP
jgi:hypothetical protein